MKIAIDPGHAMGNRRPNVYDPGAIGGGHHEADIALAYALTLKFFLTEASVPAFLTRIGQDDPAPLAQRARRAEAAGCTHLVSLHLNAHANSQAHGAEVLWRRAKDRPLAEAMQRELVAATGFRDRGIKHRPGLAVLSFNPGPAVLVELGFISNQREREWLLKRDNRIATCLALFRALRE